MQVSHFSCPHCGVSLRTKGKVHIGKTLPCPDCGTLIEVIINDEGRVSAIIVESGHITEIANAQSGPRNSISESLTGEENKQNTFAEYAQRIPVPEIKKILRSVSTPVGIAWSVAAIALFCLMLAVWLDQDPASSTLLESATVGVNPEDPSEKNQAEQEQDLVSNTLVEKTTTGVSGPGPDSNKALALLNEPLMPEFAEEISTKAASQTSDNSKPETDSPVVSLREPGKKDLPPVKAPLPQKNVHRALQQSIRAYHQSRPITLKEMLLQLQELAGVVIVIQLDKEDERLFSKVKIMQDNTTIAKILTAVLEPVGLIYKIQDGEIHVSSG